MDAEVGKLEETDPAFKKRRRKWQKEIKSKVKKKYGRGEKMDTDELKQYHKHMYKVKDAKVQDAAVFSARSELLLTEEPGYLEADEGEKTCQIRQSDIVQNVDITSAQKHFDLKLQQFGPYRINYTRNGKYLAIAGRQGHVAALDWYSKRLVCEINLMDETVHDIKWLLSESMMAVAQRQWLYIYDNQGVELHCVKGLDRVLRMEFLPYHFLLATASATGYLSWLDVSVGTKVAGFPTRCGRLDVMCQNPHNATVTLAHPNGTVTMWSPNVKEPLVKMLCHKAPVRGVTIDNTGRYLASTGVDRVVRVWDVRRFSTRLAQRRLPAPGASHITFSPATTAGGDMLAAGVGNTCLVYKELTRGGAGASYCGGPAVGTSNEPYMKHRLRGGAAVANLQFCPYEDVLGVGHADGFTSLIIPGSGEANYDALESNPYQSKSQRRETEVKALLEKVQPELITLDPHKLGEVDTKSLEEMMLERNKLAFLKPRKVKVIPKHKTKGRSKAGKVEKRKQGIKEYVKRQHMKEVREVLQQEREKGNVKAKKPNLKPSPSSPPSALDRFKKKKT